MRKVILFALALMLAPTAIFMVDKMLASKTTTEALTKAYQEQKIPPSETSIDASGDVKIQNVKKIITLEAKNTITLRGPVTGSSVAKIMKQMKQLSRSLPKSTPIYLVLDTPGGSIVDGLDLIDFAKALPQKVHTVTLFAASMGFQIAQNLENRYIITNGQLMSHRASVAGLSGQVKGELETRYKMIRRSVDYLDFVAATRMGMKMADYEKMVVPEYWVYGFDAVGAKAADEQVLVKCGDSLDGSEDIEYDTMFGPVTVTFSQCPLIKNPEKIDFGRVATGSREAVEYVMNLSLQDERKFVSEYISTGRFYEYFR